MPRYAVEVKRVVTDRHIVYAASRPEALAKALPALRNGSSEGVLSMNAKLVSGTSRGRKPTKRAKRKLTPEHLAALAAGRQRAKKQRERAARAAARAAAGR